MSVLACEVHYFYRDWYIFIKLHRSNQYVDTVCDSIQ